MIRVREWYDFDFCSKFSISRDPESYDAWYILRDPQKIFYTK